MEGSKFTEEEPTPPLGPEELEAKEKLKKRLANFRFSLGRCLEAPDTGEALLNVLLSGYPKESLEFIGINELGGEQLGSALALCSVSQAKSMLENKKSGELFIGHVLTKFIYAERGLGFKGDIFKRSCELSAEAYEKCLSLRYANSYLEFLEEAGLGDFRDRIERNGKKLKDFSINGRPAQTDEEVKLVGQLIEEDFRRFVEESSEEVTAVDIKEALRNVIANIDRRLAEIG